MTITTEQLDELAKLERAATPGPWPNLRDDWEWDFTGADAIFIPALRNAAPDLIAEVRRLRAELTQAWNERIDLSNELHHERTDHVRFTAHILAEKQKAEARVAELEAAAKDSESREVDYRTETGIRKADYDRLKAELDGGKIAIGVNADLLRRANKAEADRAVLEEAATQLLPFLPADDGGLAAKYSSHQSAVNRFRAALAKVQQTEPQVTAPRPVPLR